MITLCFYLIAIGILAIVYLYAFAIDLALFFYVQWWYFLLTQKTTFYFPCCRALNKMWDSKRIEQPKKTITKELPKQKTNLNTHIIKMEEIKPLICTNCGAPLNNETCEYCGTRYRMIRKYC